MAVQIHHLGIALKDYKPLANLLSVLGHSVDTTEKVPSQNVVTRFVPMASPQLKWELLESTSPEGVIGKFLEARGPGIHHICLSVDSVEQSMKTVIEAGYSFVYPEPRPGAHGSLVNFIHPKGTGGILIELAQYPKA